MKVVLHCSGIYALGMYQEMFTKGGWDALFYNFQRHLWRREFLIKKHTIFAREYDCIETAENIYPGLSSSGITFL